jgi:protein-tyrosine-phosphatase
VKDDQLGTSSVLFVCTANVARSPYAELLGRHLYDGHPLRLASAGTAGLAGYPMDDLMSRELGARGVSSAGFAGRLLVRPMISRADVILTMERDHREAVVRESPKSVWRVFVLGQFTRIATQLPQELHGAELLGALRDVHLPPLPEDDVRDPVGRGPDCNERAR